MSTAVTSPSKLVIGRRLHCILYGGKDGTIVDIKGEPGAVPSRSILGGIGVGGGSASLDIVWDDGSTSYTPECLVLASVQWRVLEGIFSPEQVAAAKAKAITYKAQRDAAAHEKKVAMEKACDEAKAAGLKMGLIPVADFSASGKRGSAAAHNMRTELKAAGIKARVKQDGYTCININLESNENAAAAKEIGAKYKAGSFDGMTDSYEYNPKAWGKVFGDVQYVFVHRDNGVLV